MAVNNAQKEKPVVLTGAIPEWASTTVMAQLLGKSVRRIQQLTQEGVLETEKPPGQNSRKYRICETVQRYLDYVEKRAQEAGETSKQAELNLKKLRAEVALKESQGELHRLNTAIAKGEYVPVAQAQEELADFLRLFQKFTDHIPNRMAGIMAAYTDSDTARSLEKSLRQELTTMLTTFVDAALVEEAEVEE